MSPTENVVVSLAFDRAFEEVVKSVEQASNETLHATGMREHFKLVFKIICITKDEHLSMENIRKKYDEIFVKSISTSALSRTLLYLSDHKRGKLGLITYTDNPFVDDERSKGVSLTRRGKRLQEIFLGKTATTSSTKIKNQINV